MHAAALSTLSPFPNPYLFLVDDPYYRESKTRNKPKRKSSCTPYSSHQTNPPLQPITFIMTGIVSKIQRSSNNSLKTAKNMKSPSLSKNSKMIKRMAVFSIPFRLLFKFLNLVGKSSSCSGQTQLPPEAQPEIDLDTRRKLTPLF